MKLHKILLLSFMAFICVSYSQLGFALQDCKYYQQRFYKHWNCDVPEQKALIMQLETLVNNHPEKGIVAFDWDGTLYDEHIQNPAPILPTDKMRGGQSLWHIWGALNLNKYPFVFPLFASSCSKEEEKADIIKQDAYLEGKLFQLLDSNPTPLLPKAYDKFTQIAKFEAGMTLKQMQVGMNGFLTSYPPKKYAFKKMFDIVQRFQDGGFVVWIVSGSNPYYMSNTMVSKNGINKTMNYHLYPHCDPAHRLTDSCYIAGNGARVNALWNIFTTVYDDRFVRSQLATGQVSIIDGYGKQLVLQDLLRRFPGMRVLLYAGNSDGDSCAMQYTLHDKSSAQDPIGLFIQPNLSKSTKFLDIYNNCKSTGRCFDIETPN